MPIIRNYQDEIVKLQDDIDTLFDDRPSTLRYITEPAQDPDAERLGEGNTFLGSQLEALVEQLAPQLDYGLTDLQWPSRLRPVPSLTILEFHANTVDPAQPITTLAAGQTVFSAPLQLEDGRSERCQFRTSRTLSLTPLQLQQVHTESDSLALQLSCPQPLPLNALGLTQLNLYLGQDNYIGSQLLLWLCHYLTQVELQLDDQTLPLPDWRFRVQGLAEDDQATLPYPSHVFSGCRLLQEYSCFPQLLMFVQAHCSAQLDARPVQHLT
ncbi:type VI secretion system baseplate subunit TssF, partial [Serratia microhaemolytica]|uniref:type VI secretion system baseplate subunit TssF n=1 Tax=Serratia microhaemolytica TaxID=2675110 RepID=UPI001981F5E4